jgi:hypothetical protein
MSHICSRCGRSYEDRLAHSSVCTQDLERSIPPPQAVREAQETGPAKKRLPAIIVDLDRTLFDLGDRQWWDFHSVEQDTVVREVDLTVKYLSIELGYKVIFLSGRPEFCRMETERALARIGWIGPDIKLIHVKERYPDSPVGIRRYAHLYMRQNDNVSSGETFKHMVYVEDIRDDYDVRLVFEDQDTAVKMFRSHGLTVWAVAENVHAPFTQTKTAD